MLCVYIDDRQWTVAVETIKQIEGVSEREEPNHANIVEE